MLPLWIGHPLAEARIAREREVSDAVHAKSDLQPVPCARVLAAGRQRWGSSRAGQAGRSRPFHVSQRLVGSSLAEVLRRREREPSPARALRWALDLCDALDGMHRVGWVHRDLKPQNIFILEPADRVTLIDFGLALPIGGTPGEADEPFGTPAYVSPESIAGAPLDPRADLYSLGLVMFELFSGRRPFATRDPIALLDAHLSEDPPPLRSLVPTCSVELDAIVAETLGKDPAERPADVAELTARLRSAPEARLGNGTSGQSCLK